MTENDDILIRDFFNQNYVEVQDQKAFHRNVMRKLPRRRGVFDRLSPWLLAIGTVALLLWWTAGGSWIDAIAGVAVGIKYLFSTIEISLAGAIKAIVSTIVLLLIANYYFFYTQRYNSDDARL